MNINAQNINNTAVSLSSCTLLKFNDIKGSLRELCNAFSTQEKSIHFKNQSVTYNVILRLAGGNSAIILTIKHFKLKFWKKKNILMFSRDFIKLIPNFEIWKEKHLVGRLYGKGHFKNKLVENLHKKCKCTHF